MTSKFRRTPGGWLLLEAALGIYVLAIRPRIRRWGATPAELAARYPGEEVIPGARSGSTMATTIGAPPSAVWPWLVQMGCDRAGFYSIDRLDNGGRPSAEHINSDWQALAEGDRILAALDAGVWFDVAELVPERRLVLRSSLSLPRARPFDPAGPLPRAFSDSTWAFYLSPAGDGGTRLVVRGRARGRPAALTQLAEWLFWEPAHWVMQTRQFAGLHRRAEASLEPARAWTASETETVAARH
jgi:hypothetical protein